MVLCLALMYPFCVKRCLGILAALFFGFAGSAIWIFVDAAALDDGVDKGVFAMSFFIALMFFLLSAVWAVLNLVFVGLIRDCELLDYLKALGWVVVLPLLLFLVGIIFAAVGLGWYIYLTLHSSESMPYLIATFSILAIAAMNSLKAFHICIRSMYDTRCIFEEKEVLHLDRDILTDMFVEYEKSFAEGGPKSFSLSFEEFILKEKPNTRLTYLTRKRALNIQDGSS